MATNGTTYQITVNAEGTEALERMAAAFKQADAASAELAREEAKRIRAANTNLRLTGQAVQATERQTRAVKAATTAEQQLSKASEQANQQLTRQVQNNARFANGVQNVGYQLQDLTVQIAGGTSAARALGQQLPQLLSSFGTWGIVAGVLAAALPALWSAFAGGEKVKTFDDAASDLEDTLSAMQSTIANLSAPFGELGFLADENERAFRSFNAALLTLQRLDLQAELRDLTETAQKSATGVIDSGQQIARFADRLANLQSAASTDEFAARRITIAQRNLDKLVASLGVGEQDAIAFGRAVTAAMNAFAEAPGTERAGEALNAALALADKLGIEIDEQSRATLERMAAVNGELARTNDSARKLPPHLRAAADAADDLGLALADVKRITESLSTVSMGFDLAGIEAETAALEAGASRIESAAARLKASKLAELQDSLVGATPEQAAQAVLQYQAWAAAVDLLTGAQQRQADVTDRLTQAQRDQAEASREAERAVKDQARNAEQAYKNLDALLGRYRTPVEQILAQKDAIRDAIAEVGQYGDITEEQLELATRAWADLNQQLEESGKELSEIGKIMEGSFNTFFSDLVDGSKTAGEAFSDFILGMINDITKFLFSKQVADFLGLLGQTSTFSFLSAGSAAAAPSVAAANVNARLAEPLSLVPPSGTGSRGLGGSPYAVVHSGAVPSATASDGSGLNVNIYNQNGSAVETTETVDGNGGRSLDIVIKDKVRSLISTGALDREMQRSYDVRRKPR